jgi:uncharacterized membrane protein HdeD (DUF308 family)
MASNQKGDGNMGLSRAGSLLSALSVNWWALLVRGLFAVSFGLIALLFPGLTLWVLVLVFGAYAFVDGIFTVVVGIRGGGVRRLVLVIEGFLGVLAGMVALLWPSITALALLYIIALWAIFTGVRGEGSAYSVLSFTRKVGQGIGGAALPRSPWGSGATSPVLRPRPTRLFPRSRWP